MMKKLAQAQCKKISGGTVIPPDKPIIATQNSNG